jgi:glycosyltransferase involved in cell wall biosynthesis
LRILVVEPYLGGSHRAWAEGYAANSSHDVKIVSHPGRWWKWRMRGSAVTLAAAIDRAADARMPDVLLVSDMVDLAALRGLVSPRLREVPTVLYFHESQFTYPDSPRAEPDLSYALLNWTSAVAADLVLFNSEFHRSVFFEELPRFLRQFPDRRHGHLVESVVAKSEVLHVGVDLSWVGSRAPGGDAPLVMWNHRWEHDKDPDAFLAAMGTLAESGVGFRLALCGEDAPTVPPAFERAREKLGGRIVQFGMAPLGRYRDLLSEAEVVVSTARHEFFGISVVEACAAGAVPVLPDRLSYPELLPYEVHADCLYRDGALVDSLVRHLSDPDGRARLRGILTEDMRRFGWDRLAPSYDERLGGLAS